MTSYCTPDDLIAFGVAQNTDTTLLTTACDVASRVVENFTGKIFTQVTSSVLISDVYSPIVVPPRPFTSVTSVLVNAVAGSSGFNVANYTIETDSLGNNAAIALYMPNVIDADGFLRASFSTIPYAGRYGNFVTVAATYGYATIPSPVKLAVTRLAARYAQQTVVDLPPANYIDMLMVEGYKIQQSKIAQPILDTTNDPGADALLAPYRDAGVMVL